MLTVTKICAADLLEMATVDVAVLSERLRTTHRAAALAAEAAVLKHAQEIDHFHVRWLAEAPAGTPQPPYLLSAGS